MWNKVLLLESCVSLDLRESRRFITYRLELYLQQYFSATSHFSFSHMPGSWFLRPWLFRNTVICVVIVCSFCSFSTLIVIWQCSCVEESVVSNRLSRHDHVPNPTRSLPHTFLLVLIMSRLDDHRIRSTIRDTWLKLTSKGAHIVRHLFSIAVKDANSKSLNLLRAEQRQFGDLLLLTSIIDHYDHLTERTLSTFDVVRDVLSFTFVLKVDDDSFVRLGALLAALKEVAHPRLYWGFLDGRAIPKSDGKWKESNWKLCDRFLPYQLGAGYVLSSDLVHFIGRNRRLLKLFYNEDTAVGAWLAGLDLKYVHDPRFDTEYRSRGCNNQYLITHRRTAIQMTEHFTNLKRTGLLCTEEYRSRGSYVYDWSVAPSKCCARVNDSRIP